MKYLFLLFFSYCSTVAFAQKNLVIHKGDSLKEKVIEAFGGKDALMAVRQIQYTLSKTRYGNDTSYTYEVYTLNLPEKLISIEEVSGNDTLVKEITATGAWMVQNGKRSALPEAEKEKLQRVFLTNFIPMLQNAALEYEFVKSTKYKGQEVIILRVFMPQKQQVIMDLFVDQRTGRILSSSKPDPETGGYSYYADEVDYKEIGEGVIFPLRFLILINNKLVLDGEFKDIKINKI